MRELRVHQRVLLTSAGSAMPFPYAAPWKRGAAFLCDAVLLAPAFWLLPSAAWSGLTALGLLTACEASPWQRTPGKALLNLRLMHHSGRPLPATRVLLRNLLKLGPLFLAWFHSPLWALLSALSCSWSFRDRRRRTLHDVAGGAAWFSPPPPLTSGDSLKVSGVKPVARQPDRT